MRQGAAEREARNHRILELRRQGLTLDQIGQEFGLTREAVRQVIQRHDGPPASSVRSKKLSAKQAKTRSISRQIRRYIENHPGCSPDEICNSIDADNELVISLIPSDLRRFVVFERQVAESSDAQEAALDGIRAAATYEWPLSSVRFDELIRLGEISAPSSVRVTQLFGTWSSACEAAGVESLVAVRDNYQSRWTDQDLLNFVADYLRSPGASGTFSDLERWLGDIPEGPSGQTLRNRLGTWNRLKRLVLERMREEAVALAILGTEARLVDSKLAEIMDDDVRKSIWSSAFSILANGPLAEGRASTTCLALGYVQSGKTTSITALLAAAADSGYRIAIALLGSTNLLLDQNRQRVEGALGIGNRHDYVWVSEVNPSGLSGAKSITTHLSRDRVVFLPVLKHAGRIRALAEALKGLGDVPTLIVDDEADQASLNTAGQAAESKTYQAIKSLREAVPNHLYVQYTATPYAPLLLEAEDLLHPDAVEFLQPGPGYVGGREFFVDYADRVVRDVPVLEEQATKTPPLELPGSLVDALASFCAGAVLLINSQESQPPISMLVHSTARNDVQERYEFLIRRQLRAWRERLAESPENIPHQILEERDRLVKGGVANTPDDVFRDGLQHVLQEAHLWLLNSTSALDRVDWTISPVHILVGGNKLDRGFTVEGLTVTYLNRPASVQVDTLEQRARAFGYRASELPYCQFFASKRTIRALRNIVFTEYDLRARLQDHIDSGGSVQSWANEVGLLLPEGMKPTRDAVVTALSQSSSGWHSVRKPDLGDYSVLTNARIVDELGLAEAPAIYYGRLSFKTLELPLEQVIKEVIEPWAVDGYSPSWRRDEIIEHLQRVAPQNPRVPVLLIDEQGEPRVRRWDQETGFINIFQGRDLNYGDVSNAYPGDRRTPNLDDDPDRVAIQIHRIVRRGFERNGELFVLAAYLGAQKTVRKANV